MNNDFETPESTLVDLVAGSHEGSLLANLIRLFYEIINSSPSSSHMLGDEFSSLAEIRQEMVFLFIVCHITSAPCTSDNFRIFFESGHEESLIKILTNDLLIINSFPTSSSLYFVNSGLDVNFNDNKSSFEINDLHMYAQKPDGLCIAYLVSTNDLKEKIKDFKFSKWLQLLIDREPLLSIVVIFGSFGSSPGELPDGWDYSALQLSGLMISVMQKRNWKTLLDNHKHSRKLPAYLQSIYSSPKRLSVTPISDFKGMKFIKTFSPEIINRQNIIYWAIHQNGQVRKSMAPASLLKFSGGGLLLLENVNLSRIGTFWRDSQFVREFMSLYDEGAIENNTVTVNAKVTQEIDNCVLLPTGNAHHSHLMVETISQLHYLKELERTPYVFIASDQLTESQREYFEYLLPSDKKIIYKKSEETFRIKKSYSFYMDNHVGYNRQSSSFLKNIGFTYLKERKFSEKIYLTRRDSRLYRNLVNEFEIENIFKDYEFDVITLSELSFEDKLNAFRHARYIAGPMGAGFQYAAFSSATCILLANSTYDNPFVQEIISLNSLESHYIYGNALSHHDRWDGTHGSFYIKPALINVVLHHIFNQVST
jgi:hypothetical protein